MQFARARILIHPHSGERFIIYIKQKAMCSTSDRDTIDGELSSSSRL
uniref:Uncharacterized protein n=1 Tax=Setaria italica TaxID=4555 RepID=K3YXP2_SETIT